MRPPVIDAHTHVLPDGADRMDRAMAESGIARALNFSGGSLGRGVEVRAALRAKHPRVDDLYLIDWRLRGRPDFGDITARAFEIAVKEYGYKGLKIPKALGLAVTDASGARVPVDWPPLDAVWAKAGELGVPVAIHTADPKAFWDPATPDNERYEELQVHPSWSFADPSYPPREQLLAELERVFARHPGTAFISVHFGNNAEDLAYVERILERYPNVHVDVAARLGEIGRHPADKVRALFVRFKDRVLFGTDLGIGAEHLMLGSSGAEEPTWPELKRFYDAHWRFFEGRERGIPHPTPIQGRWTIDAIDLPDDVLDALYFGNAMRLFHLPDPRSEGAAPLPAAAPTP